MICQKEIPSLSALPLPRLPLNRSDRVGEDLMYAYADKGAPEPVALVLRAWDARIRPQCEFRAFVWDGRLTVRDPASVLFPTSEYLLYI